MNYTKRLFFIGIAIFEILTMILSIDVGSPDVERNFIIESSLHMDGMLSAVEVKCHSDDWTTFPDFKVTTIYTNIKFINCSFAENTSLLRIFRSMNISDTLKIQFVGLRSSLSRQYFQDLRANTLVFTDTNFTVVPFDMLHDLSMMHLIISKTNLNQIANTFFKSRSRDLHEVELTGNKLQKIGKNDFTHLPDVWHLSLYENEITEIEVGAFDNLPSLSILGLGKNRLCRLSPVIFRHLSGLRILDLGGNSFDELPDDLLTSIPDCQLKNFWMEHNRGTLKTLPDQFFKNIAHLENVKLASSQLQSLPKNLFSGSSKLQELTLRNNSLKSLPLGFFNDCRELEDLDLSKNQIITLPAGIFANLSGLKNLNISNNKLTSLESEVLKGLEKLNELYASHNDLVKLDDGLCRNLKSIQSIELSFNRLTFGASESGNTSAFEVCESLRSINLSHNSATTIFSEFAPNLTSIDLSFNNLSQLTTRDIKKLRYTKKVDLRNNQISKINLMELASVLGIENHGTNFSHEPVRIALGNNPVHCDCHLIDLVLYWSSLNSKLWRLVELTSAFDKPAIDRNNVCVSPLEVEIREINSNIICASPPELKNRDIRSLRPDNLSCTLETDAANDACTNDCICVWYPTKKIISVDCSNRNLTRFPAMITNVHNWPIELNMSYNFLKRTPTLAIRYLANVTDLDLSNNNIDTITMDFFSRNLVDLKLHNNSISRLDETVIQYLVTNNNLRNITLHENPWQCDCEDRRFLQLIQTKTSIYERKRLVCHGTNKTFYDMSVDDVCKKTIAIIVGASLLVAFFGIVTGIGATLYHKYRREIKVWLYSKKWCLWFVTEDELDKDKKYDAFVSFSHKDEDFVENEIVAKLEDGSRPYKLCLHYRDWLAGEWIPVQIRQSVEDSRRTIIVLSTNFLESVWATLEFREAHAQALKEGRARLIIILYGEIENMDDLDPELKSCLSLKTYLKWGDPWFWDKLRYALPHRRELSKRRMGNARSIEDHRVHQPAGCNNPEAISMSSLAEGSTRLLDSGVDERTTASC